VASILHNSIKTDDFSSTLDVIAKILNPHDTYILREELPTFLGRLGSRWQALVYEYLGVVLLVCTTCSRPDFVEKTVPAYNGAQTICSECIKYYSWCKSCESYILTIDIGNIYHTHALVKEGSAIFANDAEVEPWNADIMHMGLKSFRSTETEFLAWKHNHEQNRRYYDRFFGVELEVEKDTSAPPDMVYRARKWANTEAIIKHDGSLSNKGKNGFEIVTLPATMAFHKSEMWDDFFNYIAPFLQVQPNTTGLHVHIGTDTLRQLTEAKMLMFVNNKLNREFIESVAGRELNSANPNGKVYAIAKDDWSFSKILTLKQHNSHCPWHPDNKKTSLQYVVEQGKVKTDTAGNPIIASIKPSAVIIRPVCKCAPGIYNIEKYHAFNFMTKRPTVELRMFRGLINKEFLYAALEFTDALADFCDVTSPKNLSYTDFLSWVCLYNKDQSGRSKTYPNLTRLLINKSWINPKKVK
jgi:hypothetical protein